MGASINSRGAPKVQMCSGSAGRRLDLKCVCVARPWINPQPKCTLSSWIIIKQFQKADLGLLTAVFYNLMYKVLEVAAEAFVIQLQSCCSQQDAAESEAIRGLL